MVRHLGHFSTNHGRLLSGGKIVREGLSEARIYTEDTIEDALSGFVYVMPIPAGALPQLIVIEGNRRKYARPTKKCI